MKKIIFKLLTVNLLVFFVSCSNDNDFDSEQAVDSSKSIEKVVFDLGSGRSFGTSGTMLSFSTFQDLQDTYDMLESQMEAHDDAFVAQYDHLSLDDLDAMEENTGFVDNQPLLNFETQYGYSNSLRTTYEVAEAAWLANQNSLPEDDPEYDIYFDDIERALLNEHQEVMIAGKVFVFGKTDYNYEISDDFATSLNKINNGEDVNDDPNIKVTNKWDSGYCASWKSDITYEYFDNGNRRVKLILKLRQAPFVGKTKARIVSQKKRNNGSWRQSRRHIGVSLQKSLKKNNCTDAGPTGYSSKSIKKRKSRKTTQFDWGIALPSKGQRGQSVHGTFHFNNTTKYWSLTW